MARAAARRILLDRCAFVVSREPWAVRKARRVLFRLTTHAALAIARPAPQVSETVPTTAASMAEPIHIVCGHCNSVVRVPPERAAEGPRCPKCQQALFEGLPITLNAGNFEKHLTRNDLALVIDVWAPWCGPCRMMAPHFEEAAQRFAPRARFAKLNSDEEGPLASRFGIRGIPTLIVLRGGKEIARQTGAMDSRTLTAWLTSTLG